MADHPYGFPGYGREPIPPIKPRRQWLRWVLLGALVFILAALFVSCAGAMTRNAPPVRPVPPASVPGNGTVSPAVSTSSDLYALSIVHGGL